MTREQTSMFPTLTVIILVIKKHHRHVHIPVQMLASEFPVSLLTADLEYPTGKLNKAINSALI